MADKRITSKNYNSFDLESILRKDFRQMDNVTNITVKLVQIKDLYDFIKIASNINGICNIKKDHYIVNAKSILGLLSLDLSKPIDLEIIGDVTVYELHELKRFECDK